MSEDCYARLQRITRLRGRLELRKHGLKIGDLVKGPYGSGVIVDAWDDTWYTGFAFLNVDSVRLTDDRLALYTKVE